MWRMDVGEKRTELGAQPGGCFPPSRRWRGLEAGWRGGDAETWVKRCSGNKTDGLCKKGGKMMLDF